jgi:hypothetical protein
VESDAARGGRFEDRYHTGTGSAGEVILLGALLNLKNRLWQAESGRSPRVIGTSGQELGERRPNIASNTYSAACVPKYVCRSFSSVFNRQMMVTVRPNRVPWLAGVAGIN